MSVASRIVLPALLAVWACCSANAMTPAGLLDNLREKQEAVGSYRAVIVESGNLGDQQFFNRFAIDWAKDRRFKIAGTLNMSGAPAPIEVEIWFDGAAAFTSVVCGGIRGYAKIDFSELPEESGFPSPDFVGGIPGPVSLGRMNLAVLKDYDVSVSEGEMRGGQSTYALHARLKAGLKPKTISVQGKELPSQADRVSIWYGAADGMVRRLELALGEKVVYSMEVLELDLNPSVINSRLNWEIPPEAEIFDATEEFRWWMARSASGNEK